MLLFGENGQLSYELQKILRGMGQLKVCGSREANFLEPFALAKLIRDYQPTHIINSAAYTSVDKAESEEALAMQINGHSVGVIAEEARKLNAFLIHYSTDYVFDGLKVGAYVEEDQPAPVNVYGRSKLLGEQNIQQVGGRSIILRVSWLYGNFGQNFYKTMLRLGAERDQLRIVDDQYGAPTWTRDIANASIVLLQDQSSEKKSRIYHLAAHGVTNWFGFAEKIFELHRNFDLGKLKLESILPISTTAYPTPASRPANSRLSSEKIHEDYNIQLPLWEHSLEKVVKESLSLSFS